jgi:acetylornithine aminotransferase
MSKRAKDLFKPGNHGSTFGGNPLACATALTVLDVLERDKICEQVTKNSAFLMEQLIKNLGEHPHVRSIRGKGYMIGIELDRPANDMRLLGLKNGLLFNVTADTVVRLLPPLIINQEELTELVKRLTLTINQFTQS